MFFPAVKFKKKYMQKLNNLTLQRELTMKLFLLNIRIIIRIHYLFIFQLKIGYYFPSSDVKKSETCKNIAHKKKKLSVPKWILSNICTCFCEKDAVCLI